MVSVRLSASLTFSAAKQVVKKIKSRLQVWLMLPENVRFLER